MPFAHVIWTNKTGFHLRRKRQCKILTTSVEEANFPNVAWVAWNFGFTRSTVASTVHSTHVGTHIHCDTRAYRHKN
ncbi:unnamed protein product [Ixodes persulcatus]